MCLRFCLSPPLSLLLLFLRFRWFQRLLYVQFRVRDYSYRTSNSSSGSEICLG